MKADIESLFSSVAELSASAREKYFVEHDVPMEARREVESLLGFTDTSRSRIEKLVAVAAEHWAQADGSERAATNCGPYRLVRLLGRGGTGAVYLGQRTDGEIEHEVAIKLLRFGEVSAALRTRFLRERQILASLRHPGIAHLIDVGHTAEGHPFLVMEYIDGTPIDVYCEKCSVRERLELFMQVCDAVAYAHRNLVVHRDLKPSNILVDKTGSAKLLDFGIAKILDAASDVTRTQERMLTPEYASPEQVRGTAQTTATDIYTLGAVLYKLLTGKSPHVFSDGREEDLVTVICNKDPLPASTVNANLSRDLDSILNKALRKEPESRYGSVEALMQDILAFLEHRPVRARSGDAWYRTTKFLRRYWIPVAAAMLTVGGLTAGLYVASQERAIAQRRFAQVRQLSNRFLALDRQVRELPGSTKVRQSMVASSLEYLAALEKEAHGDVDLALELATAYRQTAEVQGVPTTPNLGDSAAAEESLGKAEALVNSILAKQPNHHAALFEAAVISEERTITNEVQHKNKEAAAHAATTARLVDQLREDGSLTEEESYRVGRILANLALTNSNMHRLDNAIRLAGLAVEIGKKNKQSQGLVVHALGLMANAYRMSGDLDKALEMIREAKQRVEALPVEPAYPRISAMYGVLWREGVILGEENAMSLERTDEAIASLQQAMDLMESLAAKDAADTDNRVRLATAARELGDILKDRQPQRALAVYDLALSRLREAKKKNAKIKREESTLLAGSSYALRRLGRNADARQRIEASIEILKSVGDWPVNEEVSHEMWATALALADHEASTGNMRRGIELYRELISKEVNDKSENPQKDVRYAVLLAIHYHRLAEWLVKDRQYEEARKVLDNETRLWQPWDKALPGNSYIKARLRDVAALRKAAGH